MKTSIQGVTFKDSVKSGFATPSWVVKERVKEFKQKIDTKEEGHDGEK